MGTWLSLAAAWLAGVAWQTDAAALEPLGVYVATVAGCAALAGLGWRLAARSRSQGGSGSRGRRQVLLAKACAVLAVAALAWASTGWRAVSRMVERIPPAWQGTDVPVVVRVEGLPRLASGLGAGPPVALFEAEVEAWWPDGPDPGGAMTKVACCLPSRLAVSMPLPSVQDQDQGQDQASRPPDDAARMPRAGQRWRLHVRLHEPDGAANPGAFDPTLAYFERGIRAMARVPDRASPPLLLSERPYWPWQGVIDRLRQDTRDRIFALVSDKRAAGVLAGLSVGDQSAIDREDWEVFRRAGLGHIVSISGTHIAMLGWIAALFMRRLWSRWHGGMHSWPASDVALWAAVAASALYALLAGWGVPAQRTVWMMAIVAILRTGGRRWPWPLVWLGSAVALTALDPWCVRQAGFWLSYVAVGVLMSTGLSPEGLGSARRDPVSQALDTESRQPRWRNLAASRLRDGGHALRDAASRMAASQWLVTKALLPLSLVCFGQVSLIGIGANLLAIPVFTVAITPLALLGMVWEPFWLLGAWLIQQVMVVLGWMSSFPYATSDLPMLPMWLAALAVLLGWSFALRMAIAWRLALLPFGLVLLYVPHSMRLLPAPSEGHFQLVAVDIGQGTAVIVRTRHHTLLFDTGPKLGTGNDAGERILVPLFRALGIRTIDTLLISHEDTDHVGGAPAVLRQVKVSGMLTSLDEAHALRHMQDVEGQVVPHTACKAGQSWTWDGVSFRILHPMDDDYSRRASAPGKVAPNAMSCVLQVSVERQGRSALIAGDIGKAEEAAILSRLSQAADGDDTMSLRSTVLFAPHHGSDTSSSEAFLQAVAPELIVIQAARRNRYGHPASQVIARYGAMRIPWVATPDCGAFVWSSDEAPRHAPQAGPLIGECWRHGHRHYWQSAALTPSR